MRRGQQARKIRKDKAEELRKLREERSTQEQLDLIKQRPGLSKKERARLSKLLKEEKN